MWKAFWRRHWDCDFRFALLHVINHLSPHCFKTYAKLLNCMRTKNSNLAHLIKLASINMFFPPYHALSNTLIFLIERYEGFCGSLKPSKVFSNPFKPFFPNLSLQINFFSKIPFPFYHLFFFKTFHVFISFSLLCTHKFLCGWLIQ